MKKARRGESKLASLKLNPTTLRDAWNGLAHVRGRPTEAQLSSLVKLAFWASLRTEEGTYQPFSLLWAPDPTQVASAYKLEKPVDMADRSLRKLATVVSSQSRLCTDGANVWGIATTVDNRSIQVRAVQPGYILLQCGHERLAAFSGGRFRTMAAPRSSGPNSSEVSQLTSLVYGLIVPEPRTDAVNGRTTVSVVLRVDKYAPISLSLMLCAALRRYRCGGAILITESDDQIEPTYAIDKKGYQGFRESAEAESVLSDIQRFMLGLPVSPALSAQIEVLASLARVDGCVVFGDDLRLRYFGAKLKGGHAPTEYRRCRLPEFVRDSGETSVPLVLRKRLGVSNERWADYAALHGTRHQSMASFIDKHVGSIGMVVSQDGPLTIFARLRHDLPLAVVDGCELLLD